MNILVADDEPLYRDHLVAILAHWPEHRVTLVADGQEAWAVINEPGRCFDLLFLDIRMPKMDGLQLAQRLKESLIHRSMKIVMCTMLNDRATITQAIQLGVRDYILKPCNEAAVARKLELLGVMPPPAPEKIGRLERVTA